MDDEKEEAQVPTPFRLRVRSERDFLSGFQNRFFEEFHAQVSEIVRGYQCEMQISNQLSDLAYHVLVNFEGEIFDFKISIYEIFYEHKHLEIYESIKEALKPLAIARERRELEESTPAPEIAKTKKRI